MEALFLLQDYIATEVEHHPHATSRPVAAEVRRALPEQARAFVCAERVADRDRALEVLVVSRGQGLDEISADDWNALLMRMPTELRTRTDNVMHRFRAVAKRPVAKRVSLLDAGQFVDDICARPDLQPKFQLGMAELYESHIAFAAISLAGNADVAPSRLALERAVTALESMGDYLAPFVDEYTGELRDIDYSAKLESHPDGSTSIPNVWD